MRRSFTTTFTIAANTSQQAFQLVNSVDDYRLIHVKGYHVSITTARIHVGLQVRSQQKCDAYCAFFSAGNGPVLVEFDKPANTSVYVLAQDDSGTGSSNVGLTLFYDVDQDV